MGFSFDDNDATSNDYDYSPSVTGGFGTSSGSAGFTDRPTMSTGSSGSAYSPYSSYDSDSGYGSGSYESSSPYGSGDSSGPYGSGSSHDALATMGRSTSLRKTIRSPRVAKPPRTARSAPSLPSIPDIPWSTILAGLAIVFVLAFLIVNRNGIMAVLSDLLRIIVIIGMFILIFKWLIFGGRR